MSLTTSLFYSSNNQPRIVCERLVKLAEVRRILSLLRGKACSIKEIGEAPDTRRLLRRLRHVNLITAYRINGVLNYRANKLPPYVQSVLESPCQLNRAS